MVDIKYANAYSEVLEILKYIPTEDYNKIPNSKIELFEKNANSNYNFNYNKNKTLDEQKVSKITKCIIAILFRDYWATDTQRNKIIAKQNYDRIKLEEEKKLKYNQNSLFNNTYINTDLNNEKNNQKTALMDIPNNKWYKKIGELLMKIFRK